MNLDEYMLPDPEVDDLALDFIEQELGRFYFVQNWRRLKRAGRPTDTIRNFLVKSGKSDRSAVAVAHRVDALARSDTKWTS